MNWNQQNIDVFKIDVAKKWHFFFFFFPLNSILGEIEFKINIKFTPLSPALIFFYRCNFRLVPRPSSSQRPCLPRRWRPEASQWRSSTSGRDPGCLDSRESRVCSTRPLKHSMMMVKWTMVHHEVYCRAPCCLCWLLYSVYTVAMETIWAKMIHIIEYDPNWVPTPC